MSKYIKIKDIRNALVELIESGKWLERDTVMNIIKALGNLPTIDIVHCKDCKHRYVTGVTTQYYVCDFMDAEYRDDGYCHRGERKDNE